MIRLSVLAAPLLLAALSAGCSRPAGSDAEGPHSVTVPHTYSGKYPIRAVATTGMVADLVRNVGGDRVAVEQLFGQDVDPHLYKPTPADVSKLGSAEAIFYSGLHLEGKMNELFERLSRKTAVFGVADRLDRAKILKDEDGHADPHVWFDVSLWSEAAGVVGDALAVYDPANASAYKERAAAYRAQLAKLHEEAREKIATVPKERRVLITSHDAFEYLGRAYDIEVRGIQGISTEAEASVRDINALVEFLSKRKVKAVFVESSVNQRNMLSLVEGCKRAGHAVVVGGELFSDAMGAEGTPEGTYVGMVRHNVDTLVKALK